MYKNLSNQIGPKALRGLLSLAEGRAPWTQACTASVRAEGPQHSSPLSFLPLVPRLFSSLLFSPCPFPIFFILLFCFILLLCLLVLPALFTPLPSFLRSPCKRVPFKQLQPRSHMHPFLFSCQTLMGGWEET